MKTKSSKIVMTQRIITLFMILGAVLIMFLSYDLVFFRRLDDKRYNRDDRSYKKENVAI